MTLVLLSMFSMGLFGSAQTSGDIFGPAEWLRDPRFEDVSVINLLRKEHDKTPELFGPKNVHTLFRREVTLKAAPVSAVLTISGDDYYKFYVNGNQVVQGPEPTYPFSQGYYVLDVADRLKSGNNSLCAHSFYFGVINLAWFSADNRSGFVLRLDVRYPDGSEDRFVTDKSWRCLQLEAFPGEETTGLSTQFLENIDMRRMSKAWREVGYDDSGWQVPISGFQDHVFSQQITPPLQIYPVKPVVKKNLGKGRYFYDFGREIVGHTRIKITGPEGHVVTVHHGEELIEPEKVCFNLRANCKYEEFPVLSGGEDTIEFYDYKGFRYIEVLNAPSDPEVWVDVRHHPFDSSVASFRSADTDLQKIWTICRNAVWMGSQGIFSDCPTREKAQYIADALITSRAHLWLTGDPTLTRKALSDFADSQRACPGMMAVAPAAMAQEFAEYSLQYPLMLWNYYQMTGDREFLLATADRTLEPLFGYFARFRGANGLLAGMVYDHAKRILLDFPATLDDNFDYEYAESRENAVLNAFYYGALRKAAQIQQALGRDGSMYDAMAEKTSEGFAKELVNPETDLYLDAPGSSHSSLHANALPLAFGLHAGANPKKMLDFIREKRLSCGVYIASYVIEACFKNGDPDLGYALLTSEDVHSWREMLRHDATTCMEVWGSGQKLNMSWCHPWAASPIYLLAENVMGLTPRIPGWRSVRIAPPLITGLPEMELKAPTPHGTIIMRYAPGKGYHAIVPTGTPVEIQSPGDIPVTKEERLSCRKPEAGPDLLERIMRSGWKERVGGGRGIYISVRYQILYLLEGNVPVWQAQCATAAAGLGAEEGSMKTPTGWHQIAEKIGDGASWGQVFRSRKATKEIWRPGQDTKEDMVLTRVMPLGGLEIGANQGKNREGKNVDSLARGIYIHGTNGEEKIGTPSSHGCIRLLNDDVIALFEKVTAGTPVYIAAD